MQSGGSPLRSSEGIGPLDPSSRRPLTRGRAASVAGPLGLPGPRGVEEAADRMEAGAKPGGGKRPWGKVSSLKAHIKKKWYSAWPYSQPVSPYTYIWSIYIYVIGV